MTDKPRSDIPLDSSDVLSANSIARILAVITGALLLKLGLVFRTFVPPLETPLGLVTMLGLYGIAFGFILAGLTDIDFDRWGQWFAASALGMVLIAVIVAYVATKSHVRLGTDGILFARYSVDLLLSGQNPYAHSMGPAFDKYPIAEEFVTYKTDGSIVTSLSYPALSVLAFVPQALLGLPNLNITSVAVFLAALLFLIKETPNRLAFTPLIVMFADPTMLLYTYGGVFDILWVLPILGAMKYWESRKYRHAAFLVGLAFAVKQTPWFIGPFLAIWLYTESETVSAFATKAKRCLAYGFGGFLLPNLPFIIWDPSAWARGVLTPVLGGGVPLIKQGSGITAITVSGTYALPKSFFTLTLLLVLGLLCLTYALYFNRLKWIAWVTPAVVLFFNYRSLQNYFVYFIPIAYFAILLHIRHSTHVDNIPSPSDSRLWQPLTLSARRKRYLVTGAFLLCVSLSVTAGITMHTEATLDAEATIVNASDPTDIHRITHVTVEVENNEAHPISPAFTAIHGAESTHAYWTIAEGPRTLAPGESATYVVKAPVSTLAIPYNTTAQFAMNDRGTEQQIKLDALRVPKKPYTSVLNPTFKSWSIRPGEAKPAPVRWQRTSHTMDGEHATITEQSDGVHLAVSNVSRSKGPWAMAGVMQTTPFPGTLHIEATPQTVVEQPKRYPSTATGIQVADRNNRVWVVFANVSEQQVVYRQSGDLRYALVFVPAEAGERVAATVNITSIYAEFGWTMPPQTTATVDEIEYPQTRMVTLMAFTAMYPSAPNSTEMNVTIHEVRATPSTHAPAPTTTQSVNNTSVVTSEGVQSPYKREPTLNPIMRGIFNLFS